MDNFKKYVTSNELYLSLQHGHVILVSGNLLLTAANWPPHGCAPTQARKCETSHWFPCGAGMDAQSCDYQINNQISQLWGSTCKHPRGAPLLKATNGIIDLCLLGTIFFIEHHHIFHMGVYPHPHPLEVGICRALKWLLELFLSVLSRESSICIQRARWMKNHLSNL